MGGWWRNGPFLTTDVFRALLFILIDDVSIIVSVVLAYYGCRTFGEKIELRLSINAIVMSLSISAATGLLIDFFIFYLGSGGMDAPLWQSYNFAITIPVYSLSVMVIIHLFKIKNKSIITVLSAITAILFMALTFRAFANKLGSNPTEFYALIYVAGVIPSLIVGVIYGLVISRGLTGRGGQ